MSNMSLDFSRNEFQPLAARMRPRTLAEYIGQQHLLAAGKPLPRAIVDRQNQLRAGIIGRQLQCLFHLRKHTSGQAISTTNDLEPHSLLHDRPSFLDQVLLQQVHQEVEFGMRSFPILAGQAIQRDGFDAQLGACLADHSYCADTATMAFDSRPSRRSAHRPLPSMMMAMCLGRSAGGTSRRRSIAVEVR